MSAEIEKGLRADLIKQGESCANLGSPFTARLCRVLAQILDNDSAVGRHVFTWSGDYTSKADNVSLRLCGAFNHLALTFADTELAAVYPPATWLANQNDEGFAAEISRALSQNADAIIAFLENAPQTNEVRRSIALIPALHAIAARFKLPLAIHELGASAGLNLYADRYAISMGDKKFGAEGAEIVLEPEWRGEAPKMADVRVISRTGCDLAPIDVHESENCTRMLSYIWPDQIERVERTQKALALAAGNPAHTIEKADAIGWLEKILANRKPGQVCVVQHTIAWQYFPTALKEKGEALFRHYGAVADAQSPIVRISMEADDGTVAMGAKLNLTLWPDGKVHDLGRVDFHGRWIDWKNPDYILS